MVNEEGKAKTEVEKPPIKAVIFDFDGLLFDSGPTWDEAYYWFLELKNLREKEFSVDTSGMGLRDFIYLLQEGGLSGETGQLLDEFRKIFYEIFSKKQNVLMEGAREILENAKKRGLMVGLTTGGHTQVMTRKILAKTGFLSYFGLVVSSDDVPRGKPAPDVYIQAVAKLNLEPEECLALEDSVNGILAAKAAGVRVFGVNPVKKVRQELEKAGADRVYKSLKDVLI